MTLILDTHCWLWWIAEPGRLSPTTLSLLKSPDTTVLFSAVSTWEIAIKYSIGKLKLPEPPESFVPSRLERDSIDSLPIQHAHTLKIATLPHYHRDPFDRLLIAQAIVEGVPIVTADSAFRRYEVELMRA